MPSQLARRMNFFQKLLKPQLSSVKDPSYYRASFLRLTIFLCLSSRVILVTLPENMTALCKGIVLGSHKLKEKRKLLFFIQCDKFIET